ncbi:MAG: HAMP domain-containing sensor histidine kinase [Thermodesulfobacteriota bacterium]
MSFASSKFPFIHSGRGRVFLFFILFWFLTIALISLYNLSLAHAIRQERIQQVKMTLQDYLAASSPVTGNRFKLQGELPPELDFIRLVRGDDQLLITDRSHLDFSGLVDLDPQESGAWLDLHHPENDGDWLLVSQKIDGETIAQAGKNDESTGRAIHVKTKAVANRLILISVLPALLLTFLTVHLMRRPLRRLQSDIKKGLQRKSFTRSTVMQRDPDLGPIHHLLEQIFHQNRQLIHEMQSSLDNVAHDLRTPMTRLRAVAEYSLQSDSGDPEIYRSALSDTLEESERVLSMLGVMMSVAEAEAGTMRLELQEIDVLESLEDVVSLYQYVAEEAQIIVSCSGESGLLIQGDQTRISQVWANLLDNAIKYGHASGKVAITAESYDSELLVRFRDDGMGISESEIHRIWDRLYRGDRSRTRQGLGLGLNYVRAVIESHGGQVSVTSTIGAGACFEIRLPLHHQTRPSC